MKKIIALVFIQLLFVNVCSAQITPEWVKFYNAAGNSQDFGYSLVTDNKGKVIVSGTTQTANSGEDFITIKYTSDGSQQWARLYSDSLLSAETCFINAVDGHNNIYAGGISTSLNAYSYVIVKYDELGNIKWVNKIFNNSNIVGYLNSIAVDEGFNVYYAVSTPGIGTELVKVDSNGITKWKRSFQGNSYGPAFCIFDNSTNSILVCNTLPTTATSLKITKFSENGDSLWSSIYSNFMPRDACLIDGNIYLTASGSSAIVTIKYASSGAIMWSKIYDQQNGNLSKSIIPSIDGYIYVGGTAGYPNSDFLLLKYSLDGDLVWDRIFDSNNNDDLYDICTDGDNNVYASGISNHGCSTVKFSSDGNIMWNHIYKILPNETSWGFSNGYTNNGLYVTGYGIGNGTGCDIITLKYNSPIGINPISNEIPSQFSLSQNYPNPFNPSTNFEFSIPFSRGVSEGRGVFVNLTIYDAMGREVETLVNSEMKPGIYNADWNATAYPSGIYFYRLTAGEFTQTKKMVLVK